MTEWIYCQSRQQKANSRVQKSCQDWCDDWGYQIFPSRLSWLKDTIQFCHCGCRETYSVRWRAAAVVTAEVWASRSKLLWTLEKMLPLSVWAAANEAWDWPPVFLGCVGSSVTVTSVKSCCYNVSDTTTCLSERLLWKSVSPADVSLPSDPHSVDFSADDKASGISDEVLITFSSNLGDHTEFLHVSQISWIHWWNEQWVYS